MDDSNKLNSRKLWYSVGTSCLVFLAGFLASFIDGMAPIYPELCGALIGVLALYITGNVTTRYVMGRVGSNLTNQDQEAPSQEEPPSDPKTPEQPSAS